MLNKSPLNSFGNNEIIVKLVKHLVDDAFSSSNDLFNFMKKDENKSDIIFTSLEFLIFQSHVLRTRLIENSKKNGDKNLDVFVNPFFDFLFSALKNKHISESIFNNPASKSREFASVFNELFMLKINKYSQITLADNEDILIHYKESALSWTLFDALKISEINNPDYLALQIFYNNYLKHTFRTIEVYDQIIEKIRQNFF